MISLIETQIQPNLLDASHNIPDTLFKQKLYISRLSNNSHKLISQRQQGEVFSTVYGNLCALAKTLEGNTSGLGR